MKKAAPKKAKAKPALKKDSKPSKLLKKLVLKAKATASKSVKAAKDLKVKEVAQAPSKKKGAAQGKGSKLTPAEKKIEIIAEIAAVQKAEAEVVLTNADGKQYCRVHDCDNEATTDGHCRFHYLALWKRNKIKAKILQGGKLDKYIEDLTAKYPDKYLEMLRKDLAGEKDFNLIVAEMDVEDSGDEAETEEDANRFIEEVRGGVPTPDDDESSF